MRPTQPVRRTYQAPGRRVGRFSVAPRPLKGAAALPLTVALRLLGAQRLAGFWPLVRQPWAGSDVSKMVESCGCEVQLLSMRGAAHLP